MGKGNLSKRKLAFVDTETTGLSKEKHELIEIGVLIYNPVNDLIEREWETKIAPSHIETADEYALKLNGYADNPEAYKGSLRSGVIKFNSLVKDCIIVGQNVSFDLKFLYRAMDDFGIAPSFSRRYLDIMGMAWFAVKDTEIPGLSLENFCDYFQISNVGAHSAVIDCRRTFEVYRKLSEFYKS